MFVFVNVRSLEIFTLNEIEKDVHHLCGLVVRVCGYRSRSPGFDSQRFQIFWEAAGLERAPLSLVSTTEELLEGKVAAPV
jgi:hypothetical protein